MPKCQFKLVGDEDYWLIGGLKLKGGMPYKEVISQIDSLIKKAEMHIKADLFKRDKEAFERLLKKCKFKSSL